MEIADTRTLDSGQLAVVFRYYHKGKVDLDRLADQDPSYQGFAIAVFPTAGGAYERWIDVGRPANSFAQDLCYVDWGASLDAIRLMMAGGGTATLIRATDRATLWSGKLPTKLLDLPPFLTPDEKGGWHVPSQKVYDKTLQMLLMGGGDQGSEFTQVKLPPERERPVKELEDRSKQLMVRQTKAVTPSAPAIPSASPASTGR